jgi:hypothetical protein
MPVPLVDDSLVALPVPESASQDHPVMFRLQSLRRDVTESTLVQSELFKQINKLTVNPEKRKEALAAVRKTLERSQQDHLKLTNEREEVHKEVFKLPEEDRPKDDWLKATFQSIDKRMKQIKEGEKELYECLAKLEKIEKEETRPERKEWLIQRERASTLVKEGELGQALEIYEKAPAEFQTDELKKRIDELKKKWKTHGKEHEAARRFIYKEWPGLTTSGMTGKVKEAQKALEVCVKHDDTVGVNKLRKGTDEHVERIEREFGSLRVDVNKADERKGKVLQDLIKELSGLDRAINAYLDKKGAD